MDPLDPPRWKMDPPRCGPEVVVEFRAIFKKPLGGGNSHIFDEPMLRSICFKGVEHVETTNQSWLGFGLFFVFFLATQKKNRDCNKL